MWTDATSFSVTTTSSRVGSVARLPPVATTVTSPRSFTSLSSITVSSADPLVAPTAIVTDDGAGSTTGPTSVNRTVASSPASTARFAVAVRVMTPPSSTAAGGSAVRVTCNGRSVTVTVCSTAASSRRVWGTAEEAPVTRAMTRTAALPPETAVTVTVVLDADTSTDGSDEVAE